MTVHIMLDLETWGTDPGHDLRSIGACVFDPHTGRVCDNALTYGVMDDPTGRTDGSFYMAVDNPVIHGRPWNIGTSVIHPHKRKYPLTRDPQTVAWWADQSPEAQGAFTDPVDLRDGLEAFATWLLGFGPDIRLWSHGENMDEPMLRVAYKAVGLKYTIANREQANPWHYRSPRDTRTIFEAAGMDPVKCIEPYTLSTGGIYHHALHDAIAQAHAVCEAYRRIGVPKVALSNPFASELSTAEERAKHVLRSLIDHSDMDLNMWDALAEDGVPPYAQARHDRYKQALELIAPPPVEPPR